MGRTEIFISYSHADIKWLKLLKDFLKPLEKSGKLVSWVDTKLQPGDRWEDGIREALQRARIALLLVSQKFIASDVITDLELPSILKEEQERGLTVFWIAISASTVEDTPIYQFQAANDPRRPLDNLSPAKLRAELVNIMNKLKEIVDRSDRQDSDMAPSSGWTTSGESKNRSLLAAERIEKSLRTHRLELDLSALSLSDLPDSINQVTHIQSLNLQNNQLTNLPEGVCQLSELRVLRLRDNRLNSLPDSFGQLSRLQRLDLGGNRLRTFPEGLSQLAQLQQLGLRANQLKTLPESLCRLLRLRKLYLGDNRLNALPESLSRLIELQELSLRDNRLSTLPASLGMLVGLTLLDLAGNELTHVPNSLGQLTRLEELDLRDNRLISLPESLGNLTHLETLDLSGNKLKTLPKGLAVRVANSLIKLSPAQKK